MATGTWGTEGGTRVFRVNVAWKRALQNCMTGFHLRDVGAGTQEPQDVVDAVVPWVNTQFIKTLHSTDDILGVDVVNLVTKEGAAHSFTNLHGTGPGLRPPSFLTVPVSLKGSIRRRYGNGRMLWPVSSMDAYSEDSISNATATAYQAVIDDLADRFINGGGLFDSLTLVHAHAELAAHGTRPLIPASWYDITSIRLNKSMSSLRRRKVGVGS